MLEFDNNLLKVSLLTENNLSDFKPSKEELKFISNFASERYKNNFLLSRYAAKLALAKAGYNNDFFIKNKPSGEPIFPNGFVGSLSHCNCYNKNGKKSGYAAVALVAKEADLKSVGIDLEHKDRPVKTKISRLVATKQELITLANYDLKLALLKIVTAKEAFYKMLFPMVKKYFGFLAVKLNWIERNNSFIAELNKDLSANFRAGTKFKIELKEVNGILIAYIAYKP